jgi:hypothetical protein
MKTNHAQLIADLRAATCATCTRGKALKIAEALRRWYGPKRRGCPLVIDYGNALSVVDCLEEFIDTPTRENWEIVLAAMREYEADQ